MMPPNRGPARGARIPGAKLDMRSARRLLSYLGGRHKAALAVVLVCILFSAVAGVAGSLFLEILIDDYISPLLAVANPSFGGLLRAILTMAAIYLAGVLSTYFYNRLMVVVAQGVLKEIRDEMFSKMQELPIRYFDTHTHGDIMSHYTNDTDTLRQMISQSIPQVFSSIVTIVTVFFAMLFSNLVLTALVLLCVGVMLLVSRFISGRSGSFFIKQQEALGDVNGYIEEMINGQKVVKVFCHEEAAATTSCAARPPPPTCSPTSSCPSTPTWATCNMCSSPSSAAPWESAAWGGSPWEPSPPSSSSAAAFPSPSARCPSRSTPSSWRWPAPSGSFS